MKKVLTLAKVQDEIEQIKILAQADPEAGHNRQFDLLADFVKLVAGMQDDTRIWRLAKAVEAALNIEFRW